MDQKLHEPRKHQRMTCDWLVSIEHSYKLSPSSWPHTIRDPFPVDPMNDRVVRGLGLEKRYRWAVVISCWGHHLMFCIDDLMCFVCCSVKITRPTPYPMYCSRTFFKAKTLCFTQGRPQASRRISSCLVDHDSLIMSNMEVIRFFISLIWAISNSDGCIDFVVLNGEILCIRPVYCTLMLSKQNLQILS
jgi:hypothetical protein